MLHLIGIGYKKEHITHEQLEIIKQTDKVFLEYYTSFYQDSFEELEEFLGKKITICNRDIIENKIEDTILSPSQNSNISLLIIGDPLIATTHTDLLIRCQEIGVETHVYHNISIGNLITQTGLQFYKFGKITSIPFFNKNFMPRTPFLVYQDNYKMGAHSLFLLDLNPSQDTAYKGEETYLKAHDALQFMLNIPKIMLKEEEIEEKDSYSIDEDTHAIICSKLGFDDPIIVSGKIQDLIEYDKQNELREPLCLIITGDLHEMEEKFLEQFSISSYNKEVE